MPTYDSNIIAEMMGRSFETITVHEAILNDDTAWEWVQQQALMVWNGRTTSSGYTYENNALAHDLGNRIDSYVRANGPAFQNQMWNVMIDWFLRSVDWFNIATWHLTNLWELALIDGWSDDMTADEIDAGLEQILLDSPDTDMP